MALLPSSLRSSPWRCLVVLVVLIVAAAGAFYFTRPVPKLAPNVMFTGLTGETIALNALRGNVVLINFWATSCEICIGEMPQMVKTYNQYRDRGVAFVAVAMSYDSPNYVLNYAQTRHLPFAVALDVQDEVAQAFGGIKFTPTSILIGKDGKIIARYQGETDFPKLYRMLDEALAAPG